MLTLSERIGLLSDLGKNLNQGQPALEAVIIQAKNHNPWFTTESIQLALNSIKSEYLAYEKLSDWAKNINELKQAKAVGIIMAGNIPLVGFHDFISCFLTGHHSKIKLSDKDSKLLPAILDKLTELNPKVSKYFSFHNRLTNIDAVIATGSNTANQYFYKYFKDIPHILRGHKNAVAILTNQTSDEAIFNLGKDIFRYFGLGCRNVSKLYLEAGFNLNRIFEKLDSYGDIINHHKYKNNFDYSQALYLMNSEKFLTNNFLILRQNSNINSRISCLHYQYYENSNALRTSLANEIEQIQCIVSDQTIEPYKIVDFGSAQVPSLSDYADNTDTLEFLNKLND